MIVVSFVTMYILMYSMVNSTDNVYMSVNQVYMAGLMAAPMVIIELALMGMMYKDKPRNSIIMAAAVVTAVLFFLGIRNQAAVGDRQFLRSMIPHHASAILMCENASSHNAEIQKLCRDITTSQAAEIAQMKTMLGTANK